MRSGVSEQYRVLIVDDDEVDRIAVRRALKAGGVVAEVREATDAASATAALVQESFDCAFLDYRLPGGDGLQVLDDARAAGAGTPVIVLTGQGDEQIAVELMKAGASDYLNKANLLPERLAQSLRSAVRVYHAEREAQRAQEALRESEARFRAVHETSPDGFVIFRSVRDVEGKIVDFTFDYANPAAERIMQRSAAELLGRRQLEAFSGIRDEALFQMYVDVVEIGEPRHTEIRYPREGDEIWLRVTATRLEDGFAVSFSDITRRKKAESEWEAAIAARSRFYAAMSHELRTPINAVMGYNDLLLAGVYGTLSEEQQQGLARSQRAARHLLELVNDVLDLSKLEAGKVEIQLEEVDVHHLVDELFVTVRPLAEEKRTELQLLCDRDVDPVYTDPRRVRQIMLNLLSNAIKFGEGEPIDVRCRSGDDGGVVIEISDRGEGIDSQDLPRIFDEFVQLPNSQAGGTGLGLPISKQLAELLGGTLEAESVPGEGSTFRLILPGGM